ncbi:hypothetical protein MNBD_ALPHA02-222 [hydrothermal vent metagenome]|uniref:Uncharacterized protein n=1 Tax=hydrothermal vent metagenome TaxID=652676 RepID=A0A3B0RKC7_9ZZZZ
MSDPHTAQILQKDSDLITLNPLSALKTTLNLARGSETTKDFAATALEIKVMAEETAKSV